MQDTTDNHAVWIARVCDHLNKLIHLDVDAVCTYREALLHVDDPAVRADLHAFLGDHERHVMDLTAVVRALGGEPVAPERDLKGRILEGMTRLRSRGTIGALKAMRMNEKLTNRTYDKAADVYLPPLAQVAVLENLADERRHLAAIEAHIARIEGTHEHRDIPAVGREASYRPHMR